MGHMAVAMIELLKEPQPIQLKNDSRQTMHQETYSNELNWMNDTEYDPQI